MWGGVNIITHNKMEVLSNSPLFINGGRIGVLTYFGMILGKWLDIVNINKVVGLVAGLLTIVFLVMQIYFVYLKTKNEKIDIKIKNNEQSKRD